ncbi:RNA 2'-phosphotransferase-like protein [Leptotrombidium deliense]|uniref:2'-phosphotransferase n=1 Tax=Leptotrombidium deliense TaxID=299467 RepID=A0A443SAX9_9ACAR|nr:RNA 2'-phosphotransferase-like protein [Leptotrombidium deliense]
MKSHLIRKGKFLSLVLRHNPQKIGVKLNEQGWCYVGELLEACSMHGCTITLEELIEIVADNNKQRFAFNENKSMIRANQGHSVHVDLQYSPVEPPSTLYHGTISAFIDSIKEKGLLKMNRHDVHLSVDRQTAVSVGARRGIPVVLTIDAQRMSENGHLFYRSKNGVWLTEIVPQQYITFPNLV